MGALNGIVYIQLKQYVDPHTKRVLDGALSHSVTTADAHRVLHLVVEAGRGDQVLSDQTAALAQTACLASPTVATMAKTPATRSGGRNGECRRERCSHHAGHQNAQSNEAQEQMRRDEHREHLIGSCGWKPRPHVERRNRH